MRALKKINASARKLQIQDKNLIDARYRMNFGIYFFDAEDEPQPDEEAGD